MHDIDDYSSYMTDEVVKTLAANGMILTPEQDFALILYNFHVDGQNQLSISAPVEVTIMFSAVAYLDDDDETSPIKYITATGTPGQCYNYAVAEFLRLVEKIRPNLGE